MARRRLVTRPGSSLTASVFYTLLSLNSEERDADGIFEDVALSSAGRVHIGRRGLSATLKRLFDGELIEEARPHVYRLTHEGRKVLASELERMEHALRIARRHP